MTAMSSPAAETAPATLPLYDRLAVIRDALLSGLVEREEPIRLALLAALAGEHILLLGPPGVAKSEIARRLRQAFRSATWFERLMTRFTVPDEILGPLSIKALEDDRYHRQTAGYLPTASVAFLDEIWKSNSAILNSLLTLLNEREFDNGTVREKTPIKCVIGASNELPQEEGMEALYDRFLVRCHVGPVSESGFEKLVDIAYLPAPHVPPHIQLTDDDLAHIREAAQRVTVPPDVKEIVLALRKHLAEQGIPVSDRRWRKILGLLKTSACTNERTEVAAWDTWLLPHCCWNKPEQQEIIADWCAARLGTQAADLGPVTQLTEAWEQKLVVRLEEQQTRLRQLCEHAERVTVLPAEVPQWLAKAAPASPHAAQVMQHADALDTQAATIAAQLASLDAVVGRHLWISTSTDKVRGTLESSFKAHEALRARWKPIREWLG